MYILENNYLRIVLNNDGSLLEFWQKSIDRNYIISNTKYRHPLFCLYLSEWLDDNIQPGKVPFSSLLARELKVIEGMGQLELNFSSLDGLDLQARCLIRLEGPLSYWSIWIENGTPYSLAAIEYPVLHILPRLSVDGKADRILLPKQDGYLLGNPEVYPWQGDFPFRRTNQRFQYPGEGREFPASLCAQLLAYYDDYGGLYVAAHDGKGHPKRIGPIQVNHCGADVLDFTLEHQIPQERGNNYNAPYETVLGCFTGDWRDAADLYKTWSLQQDWCKTPLSQREDIPNWVKQGAFFLCFRLRGQPEGKDYLKQIPDYLERWQEALGIPLVAMMCGWEKRGEWMGPDYFPPYGEDNFAELCQRLKDQGIHPFPFGLSALKLPIRKKIGLDYRQPELAVDYDNREAFEREYRKYAALNATGSLITDSEVSSWDGLHAYACVSTSQAEKQLCGASTELVKCYGVQVNQADQVFGGGVTECYHSGHNHPPGRGVWQVDTLRQIYQKARDEGKKIDPDFAFSQEFPSELYLQYLDVCHGRIYDQPRGVEGVPLFAYLYHEYLICYGGDWVSMLPSNTCGVYNQAANFVYGSLPAGCPQNMHECMLNALPEECDPAILRMAKNTCALFMRFPQYLLLGKMCKSRYLPVPDITVEFLGMDFSGWAKGPMVMPAVLHTLWEAPRDRFAYAFANISNETQTLISESNGNTHLWVNDNIEAQSFIHGEEIRILLKPLDAAILEMDRCDLDFKIMPIL